MSEGSKPARQLMEAGLARRYSRERRFRLIGMLAVTIVLVIQVVGLILVIALLTIPPFIVEKYANSLVQMMVASSLLGAVFTATGLWLSYRYNLTSGASIILVSGFVFMICLVVDKIRLAVQK